MPPAKATTSMDIPEIQRRMAQIRHEMHQDVQGAVKGAQSLTDWRSLVINYPWMSISFASIVGYLIVPARQSVSPTFMTIGNPAPELRAAVGAHEQPQPRKHLGWTILGTAFSLLAPVAARVAQNYVLGHFEQWLSQHPLPPSAGGSFGEATRESSHSAPMGPANRLREYG
jgi:hypothetical protein